MMVSTTIGGKALISQLIAFRRSAGLTQKELAKKMQCRQSTVSKIENSTDVRLKLRDMRRYLAALGLCCTLVFKER